MPGVRELVQQCTIFVFQARNTHRGRGQDEKNARIIYTKSTFVSALGLNPSENRTETHVSRYLL